MSNAQPITRPRRCPPSPARSAPPSTSLLDHLNADPQDPRQPDTLTVWESREDLAAETGFSEVTIRDHLKRLCGKADLRKGQRVMVLKRVEDPRSHRAARYELLPAALDALVDAARLEAFETHPPRAGHPYHRWRQWRASQMAPAEFGKAAYPRSGWRTTSGKLLTPSRRHRGKLLTPSAGKLLTPSYL